MKKYVIFDLDGTLIESMSDTVNIVLNILKKYDIDIEYARYVLLSTAGKPLKEQLKLLFKKDDIDEIANKIYKKLSENSNIVFFPGAINLLKTLNKKAYKLFLSTGNSTEFAKKALKKGGVYDLFELVLGSDNLQKGPEHLEYFKDYTQDDDFYKNAVYIGDGAGDREFAKGKNILFVHIGNEKKDKYEIENVKDLLNLNIL